MKKYLLMATLFFAVSIMACKETKNETVSTVNIDAEGEADSLSMTQNTLDENVYIKATLNGVEKEFQHVDYGMHPDPTRKTYYNKSKLGGSSITVSRGTHNDMRQKIVISLINIDAETLQYPYEWKLNPVERNNAVKIIYEPKKSGVPISYYSNENTVALTLTSYKDGVLEGKFSAKVTNMAKRVIEIKDGSFKMKLDKLEQ
jgi:hypothetical protein